MPQTLILSQSKISLNTLHEIWLNQNSIALSEQHLRLVDQAAKTVRDAASSDQAVYGVNTGFGKLASVRIDAEDVITLQRNLILSHCGGVGDNLDVNTTRMMMILKILSLGQGASGVRRVVIKHLQQWLEAGITPCVPQQGSVGASGDLAPLAHMTAAMMGYGKAFYQGEIKEAGELIQKLSLEPLTLGPKEGLALINGTQFSTALALRGFFEAWQSAVSSVLIAAMSLDATMGSTAPLRPEIHELRGQRGQIDVAAAMRRVLEESGIRESHRFDDSRVQDPYCMRCMPQVTGAAIDLLRFAGKTLEIEANAVTDNPLVIGNQIISGGNFHAEPVAFAADQIAIAIAEIGSIAQRRIALMVDPALSCDLPAFLSPKAGLNSGYMLAEIASAALMSENKHLANPCSTDSTPTSANQEDHVSMAAHGARRLTAMNTNLKHILAVELMCAAQGIGLREPLKTSPVLAEKIAEFRKWVQPLDEDRFLHTDMEAAASFIAEGSLLSYPSQPDFS